MKLTVVARTYEVPPQEEKNSFRLVVPHDPEIFKKDMKVLAGKAAGICYMPDDYLSEGIQNEEKAINRSSNNATSGHYSVYEHGHITFLLEINKMVAMILNSMGLYATSEKSARYTVMTPETTIEQEMYDKWIEKLSKVISAFYGDYKTEKEIHKLAMENARYMLSVFTPTVMEYTVPYNRAILLCQWLEKYSIMLLDHKNTERVDSTVLEFCCRLSADLLQLKELLEDAIYEDKDHVTLEDHKNVFYSNLFIDNCIEDFEFNDIYGDLYKIKYKGTFAMLAQAQRHRTIHYKFELEDYYSNFYVPKIISGSILEKEWKEDIKSVYKSIVMPQGTILTIIESGRFEDFILKSKERLCARAQLEICKNTTITMEMFILNKHKLSTSNQRELDKLTLSDKVCPRCRFDDYTCKEPCNMSQIALTRTI